MGHRITWRSRPRSTNRWPLRVLEIEAADLPVIDDGWVLIGPLTAQAVTELVYRVKAVRFEGSCQVLDGDTDPTATVDQTAELESGLDELDVFQAASYHFDDVPVTGCALEGYYGYSNGHLHPINHGPWWDGAPFDVSVADVFVTEDGDYYLPGSFTVTSDDGLVSWGSEQHGSWWVEFTANLILKTGTFPIIAAAQSMDGETASPYLNITATEWLPYADRAGSDAWNTATGEPANGGPGG